MTQRSSRVRGIAALLILLDHRRPDLAAALRMAVTLSNAYGIPGVVLRVAQRTATVNAVWIILADYQAYFIS